VGDFAECRINVAVEFRLINLNGQLDLVALKGFESAFHRVRSVSVRFPSTLWRNNGDMTLWKPHALAAPHTGQINLRIGDKVVTTVDVDGAPQGTEGKVILANGFNWLRYRVQFTNGSEIGDLDHRNIAPIGRAAKRLAKQAKRAK
jgi:hypothetical protein